MALRTESEQATIDFIEKFVRDHWEQQKTVCYLSSLGVNLKREVPSSLSVLAEGLTEFLRQNPVVQVVQFPGIYQKIGAVPLSVDLPEDLRELFSKSTQSADAQAKPSYTQEFWDGFIKPIGKEPRFVCVGEGGLISIRDGEKGEETGIYYEIREEDLTKSTGFGSISDRVLATHEAINTWLKKHKLDAKVFAPTTSRKHQLGKYDRLSIFLSAFDGLPAEDLARIEIPLDVLLKLNSKK